MKAEVYIMRKLLSKLDPKYLKVCGYAAVTVIVTILLLYIISRSGGFWTTLWNVFTAVLSPILIGGIICYLFLPIVNKIERHLSAEPMPWNRAAAVAILYLAIAAVLVLLILGFSVLLKGSLDSLKNLNIETIKTYIMSVYDQFEDILQSLNAEMASSGLPLEKITGIITSVINGVAGFLSSMLFGVIFSIYFMLDEKNLRKYWGRVIHLISGGRGGTAVRQFVKDADACFSGYIRGQFTDALLVGIVTSITFVIAGIPYGIVIALIVGVGNLIPYVGPILGYGAIILFCVITGEFGKLVLGLILMAIIMFIDGNVINPKLLSASVEVHPLLVVAALIAGGAVGGFLGMIIAVPTAALIKLYFERFLAKREQSLAAAESKKE